MFSKTIASACVAALLSVAAPASAEEIRQHSTTLPDGHVVVIVEYTTSGFLRHQTRLQTIYDCDAGGANCQPRETFQTADGGGGSVIIPSTAAVAAATAVRPNRTSINTSTFSSAYQSSENNNQVVNDSLTGGSIENGLDDNSFDGDGGKG